jgi:hypothetical protein
MPAVHIDSDTPTFHPAFLAVWADSLYMPVFRATLQWNGFSGAPGYTNMHFELGDTPTQTQLNDTLAKLNTFLLSVGTYIPSNVNIGFPFIMEQFDAATGELTDTHPVTPPNNINGFATGNYSSASGACITWATNSIINGRRLRGRTFFVPLGASAFGTDGTLNPSLVSGVNNAASAFLASTSGLQFVIWSRPDPGAANGIIGAATSGTVADRAAVLRSRRD